VRFNFSGSGQGPEDEALTDLDAFRRNTFSKERDEALRMLRAIQEREVGDGRILTERLGLFGHSRGGAAALLAAAVRPVQALVTWSAVGTAQRWNDAMRQAWRQAGEIEIVNGRTGQKLTIGTELLDDIEHNREALDLTAAAGRRKAPWLVIHGDADETVPVADARALHDAATEPRALHIVDDASHTFAAGHPFTGPTPHLIEAMNATQRWFHRHLVVRSA
ncbi:MAG: alpha/beta hydrolase, partial [Acidobacteriota bacterium]